MGSIPITRSISLTVAAALTLSACFVAVTPRPGQPIEPTDERGAVCGHIAIRSHTASVPPANPGADWASVGPGVYAELRVYLLGTSPRRMSTPSILGDGLFCWQLPPGDYLLIGSPIDDMSAPAVAQRHWPLAALRVVPGPEISCVGDLEIETSGEIVSLVGPPRMEFGVGGVDILNTCSGRMREVETRFAPLAALPRTQLMVDASDLSFEDPGLFAAVGTRLDAADGSAAQPIDESPKR